MKAFDGICKTLAITFSVLAVIGSVVALGLANRAGLDIPMMWWGAVGVSAGLGASMGVGMLRTYIPDSMLTEKEERARSYHRYP